MFRNRAACLACLLWFGLIAASEQSAYTERNACCGASGPVIAQLPTSITVVIEHCCQINYIKLYKSVCVQLLTDIQQLYRIIASFKDINKRHTHHVLSSSTVAIPVQLHSFLNCSCTADHDDISRMQIYSFKVD